MVEVRSITKRFPGVVALEEVSVAVEPGSCHALVGENGAGKSTLGKIIAGIYSPDSGEVFLDGAPVRFASPREAFQAGISMVHQELLFCENLSVAENLCLGDLPTRGPFVDRKEMRRLALAELQSIGAEIDPDELVGNLPISKQQLVQIAGAIGKGARVLVFDEPTSSLTGHESERLFSLIDELKARGVTCIYVSHRLDEIFRLCDAVTVLRDGRVVETVPASSLNHESLVRMMIGRELAAEYAVAVDTVAGDEALRVEGLSSPGKFSDITFNIRKGEVVGLAGLVGAGRTEIAAALFGLDRSVRGSIFVQGNPVRITSPILAKRLGLGLVPEDRKRQGLVLSMNARENVSLPNLGVLSRLGWMKRSAEATLTQKYYDALNVRAPGIEAATDGLSGGNQQKLVLAKWLAADCDVLIVDEPTRGVDVGAKAEIHALLRGLAASGKALLLISSDLPEMLTLSTRTYVLREGKMAGEVARKDATEESLMRLMAGLPPAEV
ncbi:MAG: sugar ABC transporter ATP-binding protein [Fimbriimonadaceae bacterium]